MLPEVCPIFATQIAFLLNHELGEGGISRVIGFITDIGIHFNDIAIMEFVVIAVAQVCIDRTGVIYLAYTLSVHAFALEWAVPVRADVMDTEHQRAIPIPTIKVMHADAGQEEYTVVHSLLLFVPDGNILCLVQSKETFGIGMAASALQAWLWHGQCHSHIFHVRCFKFIPALVAGKCGCPSKHSLLVYSRLKDAWLYLHDRMKIHLGETLAVICFPWENSQFFTTFYNRLFEKNTNGFFIILHGTVILIHSLVIKLVKGTIYLRNRQCGEDFA